MEIKANFEAEKYYLAFKDKWKEVQGHLVTVGGFEFVVSIHENSINVSEKTSGAGLFDIALAELFKEAVGPEIQKKIERVGFEKMREGIKKMQDIAFKQNGPMPEIEKLEVKKAEYWAVVFRNNDDKVQIQTAYTDQLATEEVAMMFTMQTGVEHWVMPV